MIGTTGPGGFTTTPESPETTGTGLKAGTCGDTTGVVTTGTDASSPPHPLTMSVKPSNNPMTNLCRFIIAITPLNLSDYSISQAAPKANDLQICGNNFY
jgi:hypothetical protein